MNMPWIILKYQLHITRSEINIRVAHSLRLSRITNDQMEGSCVMVGLKEDPCGGGASLRDYSIIGENK